MKCMNADKEELTVTVSEDGSLTFREYVSGNPAQVGFGEVEHATYLLLDSKNAKVLGKVLSTERPEQHVIDRSFWQTFIQEVEFLSDILDMCDAHKIRYTYKALGSESSYCLRESSQE